MTAWLASVAGILTLAVIGCASPGISLRSVPQNPLSQRLNLTSRQGPQPTQRTLQVLRSLNLENEWQEDIRPLLEQFQDVVERAPSAERIYAMAELAYLGAKRLEDSKPKMASDLYGASVLHSYRYLFDPRFAPYRNPYDPQFRGACDLYNNALEGALRISCNLRELVPNSTVTIRTTAGPCDIRVVLHNTRWKPEDFQHFEFVSDYEIRGLKNHYRRYGLGVPMMAVRHSYPGEPAVAKYYPSELSFPVTAFMRPDFQSKDAPGRLKAVLELYDPLATEDLVVGDRLVSLEADLTTPLAYFLSRTQGDTLATIGLFRPEELLKMRPDRPDPIMGLYMAQPYEPDKIPVLLVHGLWSSPMTWMEMFNDLRSSPEIRQHYQIWFYLYPTGQPFWQSAAQLRRDLAEARHLLDPYHQEPALDEMVLVGHSMGGLISRMQTLQSKDDYWKLVSRARLDEINATAVEKAHLRDTFFFLPNPSIRRVVTIGTPHRGSKFSNMTTQWLLSKLIRMPQALIAGRQRILASNENLLARNSLLEVETSIDSLSPESPIFPVMHASAKLPWVKYHNVMGVLPKDSWITRLSETGDGVVGRSSAHIDDAVSEITVPADHTTVHTHPAAVLEVRRILLEHLAELQGRAVVPYAGPTQHSGNFSDPFAQRNVPPPTANWR